MKKEESKTPKSDEYSRFQELTRKLIAVPKREVDKQKEKYEKEKRPAK